MIRVSICSRRVAYVSVLGPGGVGGFLAGALARTGQEVTVIARPETAAHIREHGLEVQSVRLGSFTARPAAVESLERPTEVLLVATKATGLRDALERIRIDPELVVPLLNGVDHIAVNRDPKARLLQRLKFIVKQHPSLAAIKRRLQNRAKIADLRSEIASVRAASLRRNLPDGLTPREAEVLGLIAAGRTNREISDDLTLSVRTVARHITNIYAKIGARGKADATAYAIGHRLQ